MTDTVNTYTVKHIEKTLGISVSTVTEIRLDLGIPNDLPSGQKKKRPSIDDLLLVELKHPLVEKRRRILNNLAR